MDFGICQKISSYITRPPRTRYNIEDLGPQRFHLRSHEYERIDFVVINDRQQQVECSFFREIFHNSAQKVEKQTVIFLHANSSSRLAAKNYLGELLPFFNVACLDCSGSGNSEGDFVTLGYYEKEDLRVLIKKLKQKYGLKNFFLWGRSMGAVTALLYAAKYGDLLGVVADNAFSDLQLTCKQLKNSYFPILPDFLLETLLQQTQQHIDTNVNKPLKIAFSILKLKPIQVVKKITCPIFYIYSENDKIVANYHTKKLYEQSNYPKRIMSVKGDHNGIRDVDIKGKVVDYLLQIVLNHKKQNINIRIQEILQKEQIEENNQNDKNSELKKMSKFQFQSPLNQYLCKSYLKNNPYGKTENNNPYYIKSEITHYKTHENFKQRNDPQMNDKNEYQKRRQSLFSSFGHEQTRNGSQLNKRKRRKIFENVK